MQYTKKDIEKGVVFGTNGGSKHYRIKSISKTGNVRLTCNSTISLEALLSAFNEKRWIIISKPLKQINYAVF